VLGGGRGSSGGFGRRRWDTAETRYPDLRGEDLSLIVQFFERLEFRQGVGCRAGRSQSVRDFKDWC
jgi:hypothetical protein